MLAFLISGGIATIGLVVLAPLYVFYTIGSLFGANFPTAFAIGGYVMLAIYLEVNR